MRIDYLSAGGVIPAAGKDHGDPTCGLPAPTGSNVGSCMWEYLIAWTHSLPLTCSIKTNENKDLVNAMELLCIFFLFLGVMVPLSKRRAVCLKRPSHLSLISITQTRV